MCGARSPLSKMDQPLGETPMFEALENACDYKNFENYGIKQMDGKSRISGPGVDTEGMGVTMGGGKWPGRLLQMCQEYTSDKFGGEEEFYAMWFQTTSTKGVPAFAKQLCVEKTGDCDAAALADAYVEPLPEKRKKGRKGKKRRKKKGKKKGKRAKKKKEL